MLRNGVHRQDFLLNLLISGLIRVLQDTVRDACRTISLIAHQGSGIQLVARLLLTIEALDDILTVQAM